MNKREKHPTVKPQLVLYLSQGRPSRPPTEPLSSSRLVDNDIFAFYLHDTSHHAPPVRHTSDHRRGNPNRRGTDSRVIGSRAPGGTASAFRVRYRETAERRRDITRRARVPKQDRPSLPLGVAIHTVKPCGQQRAHTHTSSHQLITRDDASSYLQWPRVNAQATHMHHELIEQHRRDHHADE